MMEAGSRDLLLRFAGSTDLTDRPPAPPPPSVEAVAAEVELSLGLSLGGRFGAAEKTKLIRSSSISAFPFFAAAAGEVVGSAGGGEVVAGPTSSSMTSLARTCSLPVAGVEEDYRKRKELQSLKRMEAKRKRSEKRNCAVVVKAEDFGGCPWPPGSRRAAGRPPQGSSSGSSSGDTGTIKGFDMTMISTSPENKARSQPEQPLKKIEKRASWTGEMERGMMEEMPCVSTRGVGPDGRKIEGFLYKYRKGEEVRIVCVCHGSFLTPAEFVRHAGGGNVDHPLRHIVVNRNPSTLV